jgi:nicotinate-nucleotide adenylyltransferase
MKTGLFFGSFNPVHSGHLMIANYFVEFCGLEKVWFVVSPQNPFKANETLLDENIRFKLLQLAIGEDKRFVASDVEFKLPRPSYTYHTLQYLQSSFPHHEFTLIIGGDNVQSFHLWKNYQEILQEYNIFVYRRAGFHENPIIANHPHLKVFDVPLLNISATYIRELIQAQKSIKYLVPQAVEQYIAQQHLYKK